MKGGYVPYQKGKKMAGSVNKVILVGNLGKDPEIRHAPSGDKIASFSIATSESWKDKTTGERKEKTEWHRIAVMNNRLSEVVERYLRKGSKVYIEGQLRTNKWTDQNGHERYTTEVLISQYKGELTMLDGAKSGSGDNGGFDDFSSSIGSPGASMGASSGGFSGGFSGGSSFDDKSFNQSNNLDDDIPF